MFDSADAGRAWQQGSGAQLIGDQSMLAGSYVLVQLGQRKTGGYGLLIGPEAQVDNQRVRLHGTFFEPDVDGAATEVLNSPCVLLRLPAGPWRGIDLYDQAGKRRAWTARSLYAPLRQIGRASSRVRECQTVVISVCAVY